MAVRVINGTDTLESGFRAKYNETIQQIVTSGSIDGSLKIVLTKYGGETIEIDLSGLIYSKAQVDTIAGVEIATEETLGVGQIATVEEVMEGDEGQAWVTPSTLEAKLSAQKTAKTTIPVTGPLTINWDGTVPSGGQTFREKHGEDFVFQAYRTASGVEVSYNPTAAITRDGTGKITQVEFADVFPGRIIII